MVTMIRKKILRIQQKQNKTKNTSDNIRKTKNNDLDKINNNDIIKITMIFITKKKFNTNKKEEKRAIIITITILTLTECNQSK